MILRRHEAKARILARIMAMAGFVLLTLGVAEGSGVFPPKDEPKKDAPKIVLPSEVKPPVVVPPVVEAPKVVIPADVQAWLDQQAQAKPLMPEAPSLDIPEAKLPPLVKAQPKPVPLVREENLPPIPPLAAKYLPDLADAIKMVWPDMDWPEMTAAQVEQETCFSLTHSKCWNPRVENNNPKNNGEYGFGLGQLTNTNKYDNFKDAHKYAGVKAWKWEDRFNPVYQLRTMLYMDQAGAKPFKNATSDNQMKFALSAYNGGLGSVLNDRAYCRQKPDCEPEIWFDNVETNSLKAKSKLSGYSISAFTINRDYVERIWTLRWQKYKPHLDLLLLSAKESKD